MVSRGYVYKLIQNILQLTKKTRKICYNCQVTSIVCSSSKFCASVVQAVTGLVVNNLLRYLGNNNEDTYIISLIMERYNREGVRAQQY